ncbi:MAG: hypothetical protein ABIR18_16180, partial [Chitinophagaceae bacterium]
MVNKLLVNVSGRGNCSSLFIKNLLKRLYLLFSFLLLLQLDTSAQTAFDDLSNVKVEELTDDQVRRFVLEMNRLGVTNDQVEQLALQRGMSPVEIVKLKEKVQSVRKSLAGTKIPNAGRQEDSLVSLEKRPVADFNNI